MIVKPNSEGRIRVACFVDGFNLYHAISDLRRPELKWVSLRSLMGCFLDPARHELGNIFYFSAFVHWNTGKQARHQAYVNALKAEGVIPVMGRFKDKPVTCRSCGNHWNSPEEKQTDVNLALWLVREAFRSKYDEAFLVTQDSDLVPAVSLVKEMPRSRRIKLVGPPGRPHSKELFKACDGQTKIKTIHIERSLLPTEVKDSRGFTVARRPADYDPPN